MYIRVVRLASLLNRPHPAHDNFRAYLRTCAIIALGVFFLLASLKPFNLGNLGGSWAWLVALAYATTALMAMLINGIWPLLFPLWFAQQVWTLGREILYAALQFATIAVLVSAVSGLMFPKSTSSFADVFVMVFVTGIMPYLAVSAFRSMNFRLAQMPSESLPARTALPVEQLLPPIFLDEFLFAESKGNYLHVYFERAGKVDSQRIRFTLVQFVGACAHLQGVESCHRAFAVNTHRILRCEGNSAGLRLHLHPELLPVPVSRSKVAYFKGILRGEQVSASQHPPTVSVR